MMVFIKDILHIPGEPFTLLNQMIVNSHLHYHPNLGPLTSTYDHKSLNTSNTLYFLLRDAKGVVTSFYHYIFQVMNYRLNYFVEHHNMPIDINEFCKSDFGISRLCKYMNEVAAIPHKNKAFLYYNDAFNLNFLDNFPHMLEVNYTLTPQDKQLIHDRTTISELKKRWGHSTFRKGTVGNYTDHLTDTTCTYIDDYLKEHCKLDAYNNRYLT